MAKKKKKATRSPRRRSRRLSGAGQKFDFMAPLLVLGGSMIGEKLTSGINKILPDSMDPKNAGYALAGIKVVGGAVLPMAVKDAKTKDMLKYLGLGIVASGGRDLGVSLGFLSSADYIEGFDDNFDLAVEVPKEKMLGENVLGENVLGDLNVINDLNVIHGFNYSQDY